MCCGVVAHAPSRPPWSFGCSVLTRPSMISGKPVKSAIERTAMPASASAPAVPPVETISTPSSASPRAKSTRPVLSETDSSARRTWTSPGAVSGSVWAVSVPSSCAPEDSYGSSSTRRGSAGSIRTAPRAIRRIASGSSSCSIGVQPLAARPRACARAGSSSARWRMIGPVSTPSSTKWTVTPKTLTPCASACPTASRPGKAGSSAGWTLIDRVREALQEGRA